MAENLPKFFLISTTQQRITIFPIDFVYQSMPEREMTTKGLRDNIQCSDNLTPRVSSSIVRWLVLAVVTFYLVTVGYNRACFGVVNNVYAKYFNVTSDAIDWLTQTMSAVSVTGAIIMLMVLAFFQCGFKSVCLITAFFITVTYSCHLSSVVVDNSFALSVIGQVAMGIVNTLSISMVPAVGALWFPKEEVATAIGISLSGIDIGNIAGFNIPAYYLNEKEHLPEELWREFVKSHLMLIFLVCLSLSALFLLATLMVVRDGPDVPPSLSEAVKGKFVDQKNRQENEVLSKLFRYLRLIRYDRTFLALVTCFGIVETCYMLEVLMMGDILRQTERDSEAFLDGSNVRASHILTVYAAGGLVGGVLAGLVLDATKRFKGVAVATGFLMAVFSVGFLANIVTDTIAWSYVTNSLYGFFNGACYTALYEIIAQHMYPCNELALGAWITFFVSLAGLVVPLIGRFLFDTVSSIGVLILQTAVLCLATVLISCTHPRYERFSVNSSQSQSEVPSAATPLVKQKVVGRT